MKAKKCSQCSYIGGLYKSSPPLCKQCAMRYNATQGKKVSHIASNEVIKHISKVSTKQAKINSIYSILRKQYLKDKSECGVCGDMATTIHHVRGRGKYMLDTSEWLQCCMPCHEKIEREPLWAKEKGYSKDRL